MDPTHKVILGMLEGEKKGKLLDVGAGQGELSDALIGMGFDVSACDIDASGFKSKAQFKKADLNKGIPYNDRSFDIAVCIEVSEHIENPHHLARELSRVLKPGGKLIISTPNISNVFSRIKFLLVGTFFCFSPEERRLGHLTPIPHWEMEETLERHGFSVVQVRANRHLQIPGKGLGGYFKRMFAWAAFMLLYPVIRPRNTELLKGDSLIFVGRKR
jgi:SAM-dependent methyltransferase